ncbi:Bug family tripartite tricarboxylate transporter substrate binding protein [Halobellus captivus]|uniref:Bug family tripartite tricarboxylate transporter substrate binding protein n=1 Tax=Halobellus captivus TaxID=2592614 RepID=UPI0011A6DF4B|nr:substrate-binding domain-containing protein [Halobellus captivus]
MRSNADSFESGLSRRSYLKGAAATGVGISLSGCIGSLTGGGEEFPSDQLRGIISWGQGGGSDIYTRQVWSEIAESYDVSVAFENITGAGGMRGIRSIYDAEPDGYTVGIYNSPFVVKMLIQEPDFELTEFEYIGTFTASSWVTIANPDLGIESFDDLVERYQNGDLTSVAGQQPGSPQHVLWNVLKNNSDFDISWEDYVAYDGSGPISQAIAADEVPVGIVTETAAQSIVDSGNAEVIASLSSSGSSVFPDLQPITDLGYPNIDFIGEFFRAFIAPPETPSDRIETHNEALQDAIESLESWSEETGNPLSYMAGPEETLSRVEQSYEEIPNAIDIEALQ